MQDFEYASPATVQEALGLLGTKWGEVDALAGGTDLLNLMKEYVHQPRLLVNLKGIKELGGVQKAANGLRIGPLVTLDELLENGQIRSEYPSLVAAARGVSSPQIRNMGTIGGDLCQRPRCWYFRGGHGILGQDAQGKSLVPGGENRYHAIFGGGPAYFVSASSMGPALAALGAKLKVASQSGSREIPVEALFVAPTTADQREISLQPNELITDILLPAGKATKNATYEVRHREAVDWPLATASVALQMSGNKVGTARIFLGHVGPTPYRAQAAEQALAGQSLTAELAKQAGEAAVREAKPLSGNQYKVQLASVAVKRALMEAAGLKA